LSSATVPGAVAGPVALTLPRASLFSVGCAKGWALAIVLRYQRIWDAITEPITKSGQGIRVQIRTDKTTPEFRGRILSAPDC